MDLIAPEPLDRRTYIGSGDAAAILGVSPWKTAYQVWQAKTSPAPIIETESKVMKRGKRLEPVVLEMLIDEMPDLEIVARNRRHIDNKLPYLAAEIDAEAVEAGDYVNVEIKTVHPSQASKWGEEGTDEIPLWYAAQIEHALMVTRRQTCIVAALIGADDLRTYRVLRDEDLIDALREAEFNFWTQNIIGLQPPPLRTLSDINLMYQRDTGAQAIASDGIRQAVETLKALKASAKELEAQIEAQEIDVKAAMRDASVLVDSGGRRLATWKVVEREIFDQRAFTEANAELAQAFRKRIESRVFRVA